MDPAAEPPPEGAAPLRPPPRSPAARAIDRLSGLLLIGAAAVLSYTAAPALLRQAGPSLAPSPLVLPRQPKAHLADPDRFARDPDLDADDPPGAPVHVRSGFARSPLSLRDKPSEAGRVVGEIQAGRLVRIWRESSDWALIISGDEDDMAAGWVKKSGIAVR